MENFDDGYTYQSMPSGWYIGCLLWLVLTACILGCFSWLVWEIIYG